MTKKIFKLKRKIKIIYRSLKIKKNIFSLLLKNVFTCLSFKFSLSKLKNKQIFPIIILYYISYFQIKFPHPRCDYCWDIGCNCIVPPPKSSCSTWGSYNVLIVWWGSRT